MAYLCGRVPRLLKLARRRCETSPAVVVLVVVRCTEGPAQDGNSSSSNQALKRELLLIDYLLNWGSIWYLSQLVGSECKVHNCAMLGSMYVL